jgi:lysophospholipase L1-like esterase
MSTESSPRRFLLWLFIAAAGFVLGAAAMALLGRSPAPEAEVPPEPKPSDLVNKEVIEAQAEKPSWVLHPNMTNYVMDGATSPDLPSRPYNVSTNSRGFRGPELGEKGERFRILILGESTTFGMGVENDETWPHFLQEALDPSREYIEVINAGLPGGSSLQGLYLLLTKGLLVEPDLVMVGYGLNDSWYSGKQDWTEIAELLGANPETATAHLVERYLVTRDGEPDPLPRVPAGQYVDILYEFKDLSIKAGFGLIFFVVPHSACFGTDRIEPTYHYFTFQAGQLTNTPVLNFRDVLEENPEGYFYDGVHMTRQGNKAVAEYVADQLMDDSSIRLGPLWNRAVNRMDALRRVAPEESSPPPEAGD